MNTTNTKNTKKYYYFYYYVWRIPKTEFLKEVPDNWEEEVINGIYRCGAYKAIQIN